MSARLAVLLLGTAAVLAGCQREEREFRSDPVSAETEETVALTPLSPGTAPPVTVPSQRGKEYEANAYHISNGQRLFAWYNCTGCHANGGGGSGPPLMDDRWIYGAAIENIVETIREGRPNGMPSFRGKVPDDQIWELAAYVRSMGRMVDKSAAPGRKDDMHSGMGENRRPPITPAEGGSTPPSADMPQ